MGVRNAVYLLLAVSTLTALAFAQPLELVMKKRELSLSSIAFQRHRRAGNVTLPIGGAIGTIGLYFTEITVGGQVFRVSVDTGSSTLFVPSRNCVIDGTTSECFHTIAPYAFTSTAQYLPCTSTGCSGCRTVDNKQTCIVTVRYGDGSFVNADAVSDTISLAGMSSSFQVTGEFGAVYEEAEHFATQQNDGLWGLAYQPLSKIVPLFDSMVNAGMPDIFSMCLNSVGGALVLGGVNTRYQTGTPQYTPITRKTYYVVNMVGMSVGGESVTTSIPETIVDSGTTLFLLPSGGYSSLKQTMQSGRCNLEGMCGADHSIWDGSTCFGWPDSYINEYPTITLTLQGVEGQPPVVLNIPPSTYFLKVSSTTGRPCRFLGIGENSGGSQVILGDTIMQQYNVIFDRANSRVGFATRSSACDLNLALVPEAPYSLNRTTTLNVPALIISLALIVFLLLAIVIGVIYYRRKKAQRAGAVGRGYLVAPGHMSPATNGPVAGTVVMTNPYAMTGGGAGSGYPGSVTMTNQ